MSRDPLPTWLTRRPDLPQSLAETLPWTGSLGRGAIGRMAAGRGHFGHALALAPEDPYVLARAGFFEQAAEQAKPGEAAWLAAMAGLGRLDLLDEAADGFSRVKPGDRRWIAGLAAAWDPARGQALLSDDMATERAACLLAAGDVEGAEALLADHRRSAERSLLLAAGAARRGDYRQARVRIDAAFAAQGLPTPLREETDRPAELGDFGGAVQAADDPETVSVIVPVKDAAATLPMALDSLRAQSWRALEILVVDDGSADGSADLARELAARDTRIRVLANEGTPGAAGARNAGMAAATGAWIAFHDADDWSHPLRIQQQVEAARTERALASVSRHFRLAGGGPTAPRVFPILRACPISVVVRADAARAAGPFEDAPVGTDSEWLSRLDLLFGRMNVVRLPRAHVVAGWTEASLSGSPVDGMATTAGRQAREAYERDWRARHAQRVREGFR